MDQPQDVWEPTIGDLIEEFQKMNHRLDTNEESATPPTHRSMT